MVVRQRRRRARGPSAWTPIHDLAFLSDQHTSMLIAPSGAVEWFCVPRFDSPSVFGALLDHGAGAFRLGPRGILVPNSRQYVPGTMVLETTWHTRGGWLRVLDFMVMARWHHNESRAAEHRRTPTDRDSGHMFLRIVECFGGRVEVEMYCEPRPNFARAGEPTWDYVGPGYHDGWMAAPGDPMWLGLRSNYQWHDPTAGMGLGFEGPRALARHEMRKGDKAYVALYWGSQPPPESTEQAESLLEETKSYWRDWLAQGRFPDHRWSAALQRSALTLAGLMYKPAGSIVAAATTSLPEHVGGGRNWDYRFTWMRDTTLVLYALHALSFESAADDFFFWLAKQVPSDGDPQIMYRVGGEASLQEEILSHLTGYEHSRPVRIGNGAARHRQHDVWGAILVALAIHARTRQSLPEEVWKIVPRLLDACERNRKQGDQGIWESRGAPLHWVSSQVYCWAAFDRGAFLARLHGNMDATERWERIAAEIKEEVLTHGVKNGVFVAHYDAADDELDASTLTIPLLNFLPGTDERVRNTVHKIADELTENGFVLRYRPEKTDDGFGGEPEGALLICNFWLVSALVKIGELDRARDLADRLLLYASPLGLYAEEVDPLSGEHLGNYPQAFSHLAAINALLDVIDAETAWEGRPAL
jgi:alpha,alpha-trehalase